jgi:hypothetical protein
VQRPGKRDLRPVGELDDDLVERPARAEQELVAAGALHGGGDGRADGADADDRDPGH